MPLVPPLLSLAAGAMLFLAVSAPQADRMTNAPQETRPMHHAHGTFDVQMGKPTPGPAEGTLRFTMTKVFHGDLDGTGTGEMLGAGDYTKGHAGYVAVEVITGKLAGRSGSFALQHSGTMNGPETRMDIQVAPGSGTGELTGIVGTFTITIKDGQHVYDMDYTLPQA